ncbi:MAG: rod shape-determining protein RodA [Gemmatimonadota bacterium]|nr:rod shape-determining protein RodA [Gemmatimonadota bacterium]
MIRGRGTSAWWVGDVRLLVAVLGLALFGIAMIYSAGLTDMPSAVSTAWRRQAMWLGISLVAFAVVSRIPLRWLEWVTPYVYAVSLVLLVAVLLVGSGPGTDNWLKFGGFSFQPAESAKLATILMLARTLGGRREPETRLLRLWRPMLIVLVPFGLVLLQPDLGSAVIFGVILVAALYWAGVPLLTIFMLVSPGVSLLLGGSALVWGGWFVFVVLVLYLRRPFVFEGVAVTLANLAAGAVAAPLWNRLAPYQRNRLLVFLDPEIDPRGAGWHLIQSKVAIGSGGWLGQGFGQGPQKRLSFLPEQHTDFIFSVVGEEAGFVGVVLVLALFTWLLARVVRTAAHSEEHFGSLVSFCLFGVWFAHLVINIGMTVGLMPVTGLPLPFVSYGGSFLLVTFLGVGLVSRTAREG